MALIKCSECSKEVSDKAENCPHCGLSVASSIQYYKENIEKNEQADKVKYKESLEHSSTNNLKNPKEIPMIYKIGFFIVIIVVIISIFSGEKNVDKKIQQEEAKTENILELSYSLNKTKILERISAHTKAKEYEKAKEICQRYRPTNDDIELKNLCSINYDESTAVFRKEEAEIKQKEEADLKASMSPKAWKLHKKHPNWSADDCENVAKGRYWVGMSYDMLVVSFGRKPNSANPSNYGNGTQWQWCWHSYSPSCFYDHNDDGIIDSYN